MYNILIIFNSNHIDLLMKKTILFLFSVFFYFQISVYVYFTFLFFFSIFFRAFQTQLNSQVNCDTCLSNLTILLLTSGMSTNFEIFLFQQTFLSRSESKIESILQRTALADVQYFLLHVYL
jgi:hypothetical protein